MPFKNNVLNDTSTGLYISTGNNSFTDAQNTLLTLDGLSFLSGNCGYSDVYGSSVFCGYNSGNYANSGDHLTALGMNTLSNSTGATKCTALGYDALGRATLNDRVVAIGAQAGYNYTTTESNCIAIANMGTTGDANLIRIGTSAISASLTDTYVTGYVSGGQFEAFSDYTIDGYPYFSIALRSGDHSTDVLKFDGSAVTLAAYSDYAYDSGWPSGYAWLHYQGKDFLAQSLVYSNYSVGVAVSQFTGSALVEKDTIVYDDNVIFTSVRWIMVEGVAYLMMSAYHSPGASIYMFTGEKLVKVLDFSLDNTNGSNTYWFTLGGICYATVVTDEVKIRVYTFNGSAVTYVTSLTYTGAVPQQPLLYKNKAYWVMWDTSTTVMIKSFDGSSFASAATFSSSDVRNPVWGYLNGEPVIIYCDASSNIFIRQFDGSSTTQIFTNTYSGATLQRAQIFEVDGKTYMAVNGTNVGPSNNQTFAVYSLTGTAAIPGHTDCYLAGVYGVTATSGSAVYVTSDGHLGTSTSSVRYKNDIKDMPEMSQEISALRPVTFKFNVDGNEARTQYGLIAEEVEKIIPEMVLYGRDGQPQDISYQFLAPILLKEIQRLNRRITALEENSNE